MKSFLNFFALLSLLMFADCISAARNDIGEYWRAIMKDEAMPEAIQGLVRIDSATSSSSNKKPNCNDQHHTPTTFEIKEEKITVEESPNSKKSFSDDFEPRPNVSSYGNDADLKAEKSSFTSEFEPGPNVSSYGNDADLKAEKRSFTSEFEPGPNVSVYHE